MTYRQKWQRVRIQSQTHVKENNFQLAYLHVLLITDQRVNSLRVLAVGDGAERSLQLLAQHFKFQIIDYQNRLFFTFGRKSSRLQLLIERFLL